jgi:ferritin-like metal-binding protein YciE
LRAAAAPAASRSCARTWNPAAPRALPWSQCDNQAKQFEEVAMGLFSKDIKSMEDLYVHGLQDLYYAENQIVKSLPKMIDKTTDGELRRGFQTHLKETENQVKRLERVFEMHDRQAHGHKCPAIDGIIREAEDVMGEVEGEEVMNTAVIALAQAVEHYEITRYGALIAWAHELGHRQDARVLAESLKEEKATDAKLTAIAERKINPRATPSTGRLGRARKKTARAKTSSKKTARSAARRSSSRSARGRKSAAKRRA